MKPIAMPAHRPTAASIWTSFLSSGKRHLLITGSRGSGKSTLLRALFPSPLPGVTTLAEPKRAVYIKENLTGATAVAGVYDDALPGSENKMRLVAAGFLSLGVPALRRCEASESEWALIDEIGYLESGCAKYTQALFSLMEKKRLAAAVRRQSLPLLKQLLSRADAFVVDLDDPYGCCSCVIMASGLGRRFGGNKLMADFAGKPLICRALDATDGIFIRRVVVTRHPDVAALCRKCGADVVLHNLPHRSDTVRLGLEAIGDTDGCLFCPGDQPLLSHDTVAAIALCARIDPSSIWRAAFDGECGAPMLFPSWAYEALRTLPDGKGGGYIARAHPERVRSVSIRDRFELMDADTPQALRMLYDLHALRSAHH